MSAPPVADLPAAAPAPLGPAGAAPAGRASWSGLLQVSLVSVPVKAYPATTTGADSHVHQLHAGCGRRVRYEKHCPLHGRLEAGALAKGYEYAPGQFLELDEEQLDRLRPARDRALCLEHFLDAAQFDPALLAGRSLYLVPDGLAAQHPFAVLARALRERRQWGLGRVALSGQRRLALVRPAGGLLALHVLYYPAQVRAGAAWEAGLRPSPVSAAEQELAGQLLDSCSRPVDWSAFRDDTAERRAALVEALLAGRPPEALAPEEAPVLSLLDALRQSVARARAAPPAPAAGAGARPAKPRNPRRKSA